MRISPRRRYIPLDNSPPPLPEISPDKLSPTKKNSSKYFRWGKFREGRGKFSFEGVFCMGEIHMVLVRFHLVLGGVGEGGVIQISLYTGKIKNHCLKKIVSLWKSLFALLIKFWLIVFFSSLKCSILNCELDGF